VPKDIKDVIESQRGWFLLEPLKQLKARYPVLMNGDYLATAVIAEITKWSSTGEATATVILLEFECEGNPSEPKNSRWKGLRICS
jgi:hypothetical protein